MAADETPRHDLVIDESAPVNQGCSPSVSGLSMFDELEDECGLVYKENRDLSLLKSQISVIVQEKTTLRQRLEEVESKLAETAKLFKKLWLAARQTDDLAKQKLRAFESRLHEPLVFSCSGCHAKIVLNRPKRRTGRVKVIDMKNSIEIAFQSNTDMAQWIQSHGLFENDDGLPTLPQELERWEACMIDNPELRHFESSPLLSYLNERKVKRFFDDCEGRAVDSQMEFMVGRIAENEDSNQISRIVAERIVADGSDLAVVHSFDPQERLCTTSTRYETGVNSGVPESNIGEDKNVPDKFHARDVSPPPYRPWSETLTWQSIIGQRSSPKAVAQSNAPAVLVQRVDPARSEKAQKTVAVTASSRLPLAPDTPSVHQSPETRTEPPVIEVQPSGSQTVDTAGLSQNQEKGAEKASRKVKESANIRPRLSSTGEETALSPVGSIIPEKNIFHSDLPKRPASVPVSEVLHDHDYSQKPSGETVERKVNLPAASQNSESVPERSRQVSNISEQDTDSAAETSTLCIDLGDSESREEATAEPRFKPKLAAPWSVKQPDASRHFGRQFAQEKYGHLISSGAVKLKGAAELKSVGEKSKKAIPLNQNSQKVTAPGSKTRSKEKGARNSKDKKNSDQPREAAAAHPQIQILSSSQEQIASMAALPPIPKLVKFTTESPRKSSKPRSSATGSEKTGRSVGTDFFVQPSVKSLKPEKSVNKENSKSWWSDDEENGSSSKQIFTKKDMKSNLAKRRKELPPQADVSLARYGSHDRARSRSVSVARSIVGKYEEIRRSANAHVKKLLSDQRRGDAAGKLRDQPDAHLRDNSPPRQWHEWRRVSRSTEIERQERRSRSAERRSGRHRSPSPTGDRVRPNRSRDRADRPDRYRRRSRESYANERGRTRRHKISADRDRRPDLPRNDRPRGSAARPRYRPRDSLALDRPLSSRSPVRSLDSDTGSSHSQGRRSRDVAAAPSRRDPRRGSREQSSQATEHGTTTRQVDDPRRRSSDSRSRENAPTRDHGLVAQFQAHISRAAQGLSEELSLFARSPVSPSLTVEEMTVQPVNRADVRQHDNLDQRDNSVFGPRDSSAERVGRYGPKSTSPTASASSMDSGSNGQGTSSDLEEGELRDDSRQGAVRVRRSKNLEHETVAEKAEGAGGSQKLTNHLEKNSGSIRSPETVELSESHDSEEKSQGSSLRVSKPCQQQMIDGREQRQKSPTESFRRQLSSSIEIARSLAMVEAPGLKTGAKFSEEAVHCDQVIQKSSVDEEKRKASEKVEKFAEEPSDQPEKFVKKRRRRPVGKFSPEPRFLPKKQKVKLRKAPPVESTSSSPPFLPEQALPGFAPLPVLPGHASKSGQANEAPGQTLSHSTSKLGESEVKLPLTTDSILAVKSNVQLQRKADSELSEKSSSSGRGNLRTWAASGQKSQLDRGSAGRQRFEQTSVASGRHVSGQTQSKSAPNTETALLAEQTLQKSVATENQGVRDFQANCPATAVTELAAPSHRETTAVLIQKTASGDCGPLAADVGSKPRNQVSAPPFNAPGLDAEAGSSESSPTVSPAEVQETQKEDENVQKSGESTNQPDPARPQTTSPEKDPKDSGLGTAPQELSTPAAKQSENAPVKAQIRKRPKPGPRAGTLENLDKFLLLKPEKTLHEGCGPRWSRIDAVVQEVRISASQESLSMTGKPSKSNKPGEALPKTVARRSLRLNTKKLTTNPILPYSSAEDATESANFMPKPAPKKTTLKKPVKPLGRPVPQARPQATTARGPKPKVAQESTPSSESESTSSGSESESSDSSDSADDKNLEKPQANLSERQKPAPNARVEKADAAKMDQDHFIAQESPVARKPAAQVQNAASGTQNLVEHATNPLPNPTVLSNERDLNKSQRRIIESGSDSDVSVVRNTAKRRRLISEDSVCGEEQIDQNVSLAVKASEKSADTNNDALTPASVDPALSSSDNESEDEHTRLKNAESEMTATSLTETSEAGDVIAPKTGRTGPTVGKVLATVTIDQGQSVHVAEKSDVSCKIQNEATQSAVEGNNDNSGREGEDYHRKPENFKSAEVQRTPIKARLRNRGFGSPQAKQSGIAGSNDLFVVWASPEGDKSDQSKKRPLGNQNIDTPLKSPTGLNEASRPGSSLSSDDGCPPSGKLSKRWREAGSLSLAMVAAGQSLGASTAFRTPGKNIITDGPQGQLRKSVDKSAEKTERKSEKSGSEDVSARKSELKHRIRSIMSRLSSADSEPEIAAVQTEEIVTGQKVVPPLRLKKSPTLWQNVPSSTGQDRKTKGCEPINQATSSLECRASAKGQRSLLGSEKSSNGKNTDISMLESDLYLSSPDSASKNSSRSIPLGEVTKTGAKKNLFGDNTTSTTAGDRRSCEDVEFPASVETSPRYEHVGARDVEATVGVGHTAHDQRATALVEEGNAEMEDSACVETPVDDVANPQLTFPGECATLSTASTATSAHGSNVERDRALSTPRSVAKSQKRLATNPPNLLPEQPMAKRHRAEVFSATVVVNKERSDGSASEDETMVLDFSQGFDFGGGQGDSGSEDSDNEEQPAYRYGKDVSASDTGIGADKVHSTVANKSASSIASRTSGVSHVEGSSCEEGMWETFGSKHQKKPTESETDSGQESQRRSKLLRKKWLASLEET